MSGTNISPNMTRKSVTKDLDGNIIHLLDESNGGYIIRNRQIVNPERWAQLQQEERDRIEASKAISMQKVEANAPDRNTAPSQFDALKKEMGDFKKDVDDKFTAILAALKK